MVGGGPAGAWAAVAASEAGARVVLVDKGYLGTSGATAPSNTGTWFVPPGEGRRIAIEQRQPRTGGLADPRWVERTLDTAWEKLHCLAAWGYPFPDDDEGRPYLANLRGPDYMHFMRRRVLAAGVTILDHHPALELLGDGEAIAGAAGIDRQRDRPWQVRAGAVVLATGGCAFGERMLGAAALTGDGYLMAAEAGAVLSGMEFSAQYAFTPKPSALNKGLPFRWASFTREDGTPIPTAGRDRHAAVAEALLEGPVFAQYDKAAARVATVAQAGSAELLSAARPQRGRSLHRALAGDVALRGHGARRGRDQAHRRRLRHRRARSLRRRRRREPRASDRCHQRRWRAEFLLGHRLGQLGGARGGDVRGAARHPDRGSSGDAARPVRVAARAGRRARIWTRTEIVRAVREEMLPLDRNFFRREATLRRSLDRLDACWADLQRHGAGDGVAAVKAREAAALTATSRWAYRSALARTESRGMHRRRDMPEADPGFTSSLHVSGLDEVRIARADGLTIAAAP